MPKTGELQTNPVNQPLDSYPAPTGQALDLTDRQVDIMVSTAKKYARNEEATLAKIRSEMLKDKQLAAECWYEKPVGRDKSGNTIMADGPSIRFAEIAMSLWGNCQTAVYQLEPTGTQVIARCRVWDMQHNLYHEEEARRSIIKTDEKTRYGPEAIVNQGMAAQSIAYRNAVCRVIGKSRLVAIRNAVEAARIEQLKTDKPNPKESLASQVEKALMFFHEHGVESDALCWLLGVSDESELDWEHITRAGRMKIAILDKQTTGPELIQDYVKLIQDQMQQNQAGRAGDIDDPE